MGDGVVFVDEHHELGSNGFVIGIEDDSGFFGIEQSQIAPLFMFGNRSVSGCHVIWNAKEKTLRAGILFCSANDADEKECQPNKPNDF